MNKNTLRMSLRSISLPVLGLCALALVGCSTTQKVAVKQSDINCGFLGAECAKLTPMGKDDDKTAGLRYINPNAQWTQYKKVIIDPVTLWGGDTTKVSASDQQALVNFFSEKLHEELAKKFEIVTQPGPATLKLSVALTDAEAATPGMRSISMVIPQAHMVSNLKYLATGTFPFVGAAQAEARITDSVTGQTLAAAVDRRIGGGSMAAGFQWQWGDAENAIAKWSEMIATKLASWTSGQAKP